MKQLFLLLFVPCIIHCSVTPSASPVSSTGSLQDIPSAPSPNLSDDEDEDGKVILANFTQMLAALGIFTTDPYNPAVAGPALFQAATNVVNIIVQAFKGVEIRGTVTPEQIENWFNSLPEPTKTEIHRLFHEQFPEVGIH